MSKYFLTILLLISFHTYNCFAQIEFRNGFNRIKIETIKNCNIKSITYLNSDSSFYYEEFDTLFNSITSRYSTWGCCSRTYYKYSNGMISESFFTYQKDTSIIKNYKYKQQRLSLISQSTFRDVNIRKKEIFEKRWVKSNEKYFYNKNDLLVKWKGEFNVQNYDYDKNGNLNYINYGYKRKLPKEFFICGNTQTGWKGFYDEKNRLIKEEILGFDDYSKEYKYEENKVTCTLITQNPFELDNRIHKIEYLYLKDLLVKIINYDKNGKKIGEERIEYVFYD